jgi:hypothetical protein
VDEPVDLERKKKNEHVWKARRGSGKGMVHTRRLGVVLTHRNRRHRPSGSVRWRAPLRAAWRSRERKKGRRRERRSSGFYRCRGAMELAGDQLN